MPLSLKILSNQFKVDHIKTSFPFKFVNDKFNKNINLNYVGNIPYVEYFDNHYNTRAYINNMEIYTQFLKEFNLHNPDLNLNQ